MARVVLQTDILTPTTEMFRRLKWIDMEKRWQFQKSKLMFDILNDNAPSYLQNLFTPLVTVHHYNTRNAESRGLSGIKRLSLLKENSLEQPSY